MTFTGVTGTGGTIVSNSGAADAVATGGVVTGTGVGAVDVAAGVVFRFITLATNRFLLVVEGTVFSSESVLGVRVTKLSILS